MRMYGARPQVLAALVLLLAGMAPVHGMPPVEAGRDTAERARQDDRAEIFLAALPAMRPLLPQGRAAVDARAFCTARLVGWNCPSQVRTVTDSLDLILGSRDFTYVCIGGPSTCRLIGVRSLVSFLPPQVTGNSASLDAEVVTATGERGGPAVMRRYRVALVRKRGQWQASEVSRVP